MRWWWFLAVGIPSDACQSFNGTLVVLLLKGGTRKNGEIDGIIIVSRRNKSLVTVLYFVDKMEQIYVCMYVWTTYYIDHLVPFSFNNTIKETKTK